MKSSYFCGRKNMVEINSPSFHWLRISPKFDSLTVWQGPFDGSANVLINPDIRVYIAGWWWLEPWNFLTFHSVGNVIIPTDCIVFFRGVGSNHQPVLVSYISYIFKYPMSFTSRSLCLLLDIPMISIDFPMMNPIQKNRPMNFFRCAVEIPYEFHPLYNPICTIHPILIPYFPCIYIISMKLNISHRFSRYFPSSSRLSFCTAWPVPAAWGCWRPPSRRPPGWTMGNYDVMLTLW